MKKTVFAILLVGLLVSGCSFTSTNETIPQPISRVNETNPAIVDSLVPLDAIDQIYTNSRYAYSVHYPNNWLVDTIYSEQDYTLRGGNDYIGGDTRFYKDNLSLNLMIYKVEPDLTLDKFLVGKNFMYDTKTDIVVNGLAGKVLAGITTDSPTNQKVVNTLIKYNDKIFLFNYSGATIPEDIEKMYQNIINSFTIN